MLDWYGSTALLLWGAAILVYGLLLVGIGKYLKKARREEGVLFPRDDRWTR